MGRRRLTTAVTLVVLAAVLSVMAVVGFHALTAPFTGSSSSGAASCAAGDKVTTKTLSRRQVQVSVYNAGTRSGLAGTTLQRLGRAGFVVGDAGNAPGTADVKRAVVWTTKAEDPAAKLVAQALGRGTKVEVVKQAVGPGVNVLVGDRFKGLNRKAPRTITLPKPITTCVGAD